MTTIPLLYHGTEAKNVDSILANGLEEAQGWGGAGSVGVFLSGTPQGALYWAKMGYQAMAGEKMDPERFDRDHGHEADDLIAIVIVQIPDQAAEDLKADIEQFEDVHADFSQDDWRQSLKEIGDVRFDGPIPPHWIVGVLRPGEISPEE